MLTFLEVQQFALIDKVRIGFAPGFNVFTGETGAGKSILIDALGIVLGGRAPSDAVRTGADAYQIQAVFDVTGNHSVEALLSEFRRWYPIFTPPRFRTGKKPGLCQ